VLAASDCRLTTANALPSVTALALAAEAPEPHVATGYDSSPKLLEAPGHIPERMQRPFWVKSRSRRLSRKGPLSIKSAVPHLETSDPMQEGHGEENE
jgi:hypothetical protein